MEAVADIFPARTRVDLVAVMEHLGPHEAPRKN
jgi:hypothetical protein